MPPMGRSRARGSPSSTTGPSASAASGGTKRMTVPASPQSTCPPWKVPGAVTARSTVPVRPSVRVTVAPSASSAPAMSVVSRERAAPRTWRVTPSVPSAARTSARLVTDFDPGTDTVPRTGPPAVGAGQGSSTSVMTPSSRAGATPGERTRG